VPEGGRTVPRHPGSRTVAHPPHLIRVIHALRDEVRRARDITRPETLVFTPVAGFAATSATMADVVMTRVYRSGENLHADLRANTGAASVMSFQLTVPALAVTGAAVTTAAGGIQTVRASLAMPDAWERGGAYEVFLQAQRVSGTDATTVAVMRAWQR
jgi:hypothetical protein